MKYRIKIIDNNIYIKKGEYFSLFREKYSSRSKSWITLNQITKEFPEFFDKIEDIFTASNPSYSDKSKDYATSITNFLELFGFLSWKQFDSIWNICRTYNEYIEGKDKGYYKYGSVISLKSNNLNLTLNNIIIPNPFLFTGKKLTDKDLDRISISLFGSRAMSEEDDEGYALDYDKNGNRVWYLPTGNESINDFK